MSVCTGGRLSYQYGLNGYIRRWVYAYFFAAPQAKAQLFWRLWRDADGLHAEATNHGDRHAKIADLSVQDDQRRVFSFGSGLNGYVLAGTQKRFDLPGHAKGLPVPGQHLMLTARNGVLAIHETLPVGEL